jgi:thiol-disulfide isomerase/thioredoxin
MLDGQSTELSRLVNGRVAMVSLWATWCEACQKEVDALNRLAAASAQADAIVVGVAVGESKEAVEAFVRGRGIRYPQILDQDFRLADALGQRDIPATLVVDRTGKIVYRGDALDGEALAVFGRTVAQPQPVLVSNAGR